MECKGIPGNIGLLRAKVALYDHNPFWARPYQNTCYPFTKTAGAEITKDKGDNKGEKANQKNTEDKQNVSFQFGEAFLTPQDISFCNFLATIKDVEGERRLDILGTKLAASVKDHLPGGSIYEEADYRNVITTGKSMFPHLLWIYEGSAFYDTEIINPSEYMTAMWEQLKAMTLLDRKAFLAKQNAPKWAMYSENNPKESSDINRVYPAMIARKGCRNCGSIHWTLRKYTPLFQGQDFCIELKKIDPIPHDWSMTNVDPTVELRENRMKSPYSMFFDPAWSAGGPSAKPLGEPEDFEPGVSNAPFFLPLGDLKDKDANNESVKNWIKDNYLKNKSYVMIEMGVGQDTLPSEFGRGSIIPGKQEKRGNHNYFIELVRGTKPRFMHLGYELRGFDGEGPGGRIDTSDKVLKKLRVLSQFDEVGVDDLFAADPLKIFIRQHLGDLIITFSSHPNSPWRISREDYVWDNNDGAVKRRYPIVIPKGDVRVHSGNMTVGICFNHMLYTGKGTVVFKDRQADIGEAVNGDIYATFAHPGDNDAQQNPRNSRSKKSGLFTDAQFGNLKMGYDADAYQITEIHKNTFKNVNVYDIFNSNYRKSGREWAFRPIRKKVESATFLKIRAIPLNSNSSISSNFDLGGISGLGTDGKYIGKWNVAIDFLAGSLELESSNRGPEAEPVMLTLDGYDIGTGEGVVLKNNITPIATAWSIIILGGGKVITNDMREDISEYVESISDGWSSEGFASINHEGKLNLYLPIGTGHTAVDSKVNRILSLIDKTFYVSVSYWWEHGMGLDKSIQWTENTTSSSLDSYDDPRLIQFTGIAHGAQIERSANKVKMNIDLKDYSEVLKQKFVWNCPFFDSVSDISAIYELCKMAELDNANVTDDIPGQQDTNGIDRRPLGFLQELMQTRVQGIREPVIYNEEKHIHQYFALPGSYSDINNPAMKFNNGTPYKDIIEKLVKLYGKTFYFDRYGVLIVEISPAKLTAFRKTRTDPNNPDSPLFDIDIEDLIKASFVTTPRTKIWDVQSKQFVTFDAHEHTPFLVYNNYTVKRNVSDSINHLSLMSAVAPESGTAGYIIKGKTFYDQIWDPQAEGFFGYRKMLWHQDGIYGDDQSLNEAMSFYARFKFPPLQVRFETFGVPGLKAFDVIMLDRQPLYITEINHDLDPKTNTWWMTISGEWIKSFDDELLMPKTTDTDITNPQE